MLNQLRDLALTLAPELESQPLSVLDAAAIPAVNSSPCGAQCYGWAITQPLLVVQEAVGGAWPVVGINIAKIAEDYGDNTEVVFRVFLHEVAHLLPARPVREALKHEARALLESIAVLSQAPHCRPDEAHDLEFIRITLHLWVRASLLGHAVLLDSPLTPYWCSPRYYLPHVLQEAVECRSWPFSKIVALPPPSGLLEAYQADLAHALKFN